MNKVSELHREWSKDPEYREAYDRLEPEFALSRMLIEARTRAALTQAELAEWRRRSRSWPAWRAAASIRPPGHWRGSLAPRAPGFGSVSIRHDAAPGAPRDRPQIGTIGVGRCGFTVCGRVRGVFFVLIVPRTNRPVLRGEHCSEGRATHHSASSVPMGSRAYSAGTSVSFEGPGEARFGVLVSERGNG